MKSSPSNRDRLVLVGGLLVCLAIWAIGRGVPVIAGWYSGEQHEVLQLQRRAVLAQSSLRSANAYVDSTAVRKRRLDSLKLRLFRERTSSGAGAAAGSYITEIARSARVAIGSLQISADSTAHNQLRAITLQLLAKSDIAGLMHFVAAVETGQKLLRVTSLSVSQPDVVGASTAAEVLEIHLTIQALGLEGQPL